MSGEGIKCFPDYFAETVQEQIAEAGKEENIAVFRVGKYGKNDRTAFLNYYDEVVEGLKVVRNRDKYLERCKNDIDRLSISCYEKLEDIIDYFKVTLKESYPERILLKGETAISCGLSKRTRERKASCEDSHVDWWLYEGATPYEWFHQEEV